MGHAGRGRRHARTIATFVALALLLGASASITGASAETLPATFLARGSVRQVAVTHAQPGATVGLYDASASTVGVGTVDELGGFLFRDVAPGDGYVVREQAGSVLSEAPAVHVAAEEETPAADFYSSQTLSDGFGYITTRDGTTLSVTVRLPGPPEDGPYPTVVEYSGYTPSNPYTNESTLQFASLLGYATVGVNVRGTGCSGGAFWYFEALQSLDGYDVIEAVAAQPWVLHGHVGMIGVSYPGITQLFVAATQPPHLAAITPLSVIADTYRSTLYPGGIFNDGFALDWANGRVNDAKPYGQSWTRDLVAAGGPAGEQCAENQLLRLQSADLLSLIESNEWYAPEVNDSLAPVTFVNRIQVPTLLAGAWQDEQTGGQFPVMFDDFALAPGTTHFLATNGTHSDSLLAEFNRWFEFLEFYVARRVPVLSPTVRLLAPAFIESSLGIPGYDIEPDRFASAGSYEAALAAYQSEPPIRVVFENGGVAGKPGAPFGTFEHSFSQWPPAEAIPTTWYLQPDGGLERTPPSVPDADGKATTSYTYDPTAKPRRNYAGSTTDIFAALPNWDWQTLPLGDALTFDSPALTNEVVMAGSASADLWLRSTAPDTDVEVTLTELRPDGKEVYVQSGWLRASHRTLDSARSTELAPWHTHAAGDAIALPAGELVPMRVEIFPFAHVFRAGSRLRVTVEAPGGNRPFWTFATLPGTAVNEIGHSVGRTSRVVLPVLGGIDAPDAYPLCPSLRGQPCRPVVENPTPRDVHATGAIGQGFVEWGAPAATPPAKLLTGFAVVDIATGARVEVSTNAWSASVPVDPGTHAFAVEAMYSDGSSSGRSTPSNTVEVTPVVNTTVPPTTVPPTTVPPTTDPTTTTTTTVSPTTATVVSTNTTTLAATNTTAIGTVTIAAPPTGAGPTGSLPFTGFDAVGMTMLGASLLLGGAALARPRSCDHR